MIENRFESDWKKDNKEFIRKLKSEDEKERLWAVAKLEENSYRGCVLKFFIKKMIKIMKTDTSPIVRAMAMRSLYHQSSECWPALEDYNKLIRNALNSHDKYLGIGELDNQIAREIDLIDREMKWL